MQSVFNSINILIGIGILSLPLGFKVKVNGWLWNDCPLCLLFCFRWQHVHFTSVQDGPLDQPSLHSVAV
jgi:amino acid permease